VEASQEVSWKDRRLVVVEWRDACCDASWQNHDTTFKAAQCWTVGLLWHEDDDIVTIVGTCTESGDFNQSMTIPKSIVVSIEDVK
jgi:hypothetical protein